MQTTEALLSNRAVLTESALRKVHEMQATTGAFFQDNAERLSELAQVLAAAFSAGARLFIMGNGGSACDAEHASVEFMHPIFAKRRAFPAFALSASNALVTAVANDADFSLVFSVQIEKLARTGDIALAISTSGMSPNLINAIKTARRMGLTTVAFNGKDGGRLGNLVEWNFVVPSYSIHRIQETHVLLLHVLWDLVHLSLGEEDII